MLLDSLRIVAGADDWRVNPDGLGWQLRLWVLALETFRVGIEGGVHGRRAGRDDLSSTPVVDVVRGHERDPGVAMLGVVPGEECLTVGSGVL